VDRCNAPLALIAEFAASRNVSCRTLNADLLAIDGREQWDNILLHYTPDFVDTASRRGFSTLSPRRSHPKAHSFAAA
jgi:hypothetical protein